MKFMKIRKRRTVIIVFAVIIAIVAAFFGTLYYITSTVNNYNYNEKTWINDNKEKTIDIYVEPDLPVFSENGNGVFYDYLNALRDDTELNINISTTPGSKITLVNKNNKSNDDIVFYKDHFIIFGSNNNINKLNDLEYKKVGIIKGDIDTVNTFFSEYKNITFNTYETYEDLVNAIHNKNVEYGIIPMYKYLSSIASQENYEIVYHIGGLYSYYCLDIDNEEYEELSGIMSKLYARYEEKANSKINEYFLDIYYEANNYTELQKESITNEDFIVGYIDNLPYEGLVGNTFTGLTDTYLSKFSDMTGVTYKYIEYKDTKELGTALNENKINLALNYYSLSSDNYINTRTLGPTEYVVLAHNKNNIVVNSLYSLVNVNVVMLNNMNLKYYMASLNKFEITDYPSVKIMFKNIDENSIIIIEKEVYDYYKSSKLKNYTVRYSDIVKLNNSFLLNKDNGAFNDLFNFYLSTLSSGEVKNESVVSVIETLKNNRILNFIISNLLYIVIAILIIVFIIYTASKRVLNNKRIKKEDRLYYFDAMTNLKNRNFLNDNIDFWSSTKVYPQAIVVIDINKLKVLNDKIGHEAGDNQIKAVASILIKTQRDNSEIMRTDGDEFMVYLVGYEEKKVISYIHKLTREFSSSLPNKDYGVSVGYKMILSEEMTIDDAINDALNMINKSKGK